MATTKTAEKANPVTNTPSEDRVRIKLFQDNGEYSENLEVIINGKKYVIKRGVEVDVPRPVYEIIQQSEQQRNFAVQFINEHKQVK